MTAKKAIVLLSGGIDSALCLQATVKKYGAIHVHALIFDYHQAHATKEIEAAKRIAEHYNVKYFLAQVSLPHCTDKYTTLLRGRNATFLSIACSWAETLEIQTVIIGSNKDDHMTYFDCRDTFFQAFNDMLKAQDMDVRVQTPLIGFTKKLIVHQCKLEDVPIDLTWSCYAGGEEPCGKCGACKLRNSVL